MKKVLIVILIITGVVMLLGLGLVAKSLLFSKSATKGVLLVSSPSLHRENGYVYKTTSEIERDFQDIDTKKINTNEHDYVLVEIEYNSCSENNVRIKDYEVNNNTLKVNVTYRASCGFCASLEDYYLLEVDKSSVDKYEIKQNSKAVNNPKCNDDVEYKPIIYIYPQEDMNVSVKLSNSSYLTTTYPKYNNGWEVFAKTDGTLVDEKTNKEYYALYWEGSNKISELKTDGFVVKGEETSIFLEGVLKQQGLNDREINEFIIYWLPKLEKNKYNYIRFETEEEINSYMKLDVNPKPDTVIRVWMTYKPLNKKIKVEEQILKTPERKGFTVVEWGGSSIK